MCPCGHSHASTLHQPSITGRPCPTLPHLLALLADTNEAGTACQTDAVGGAGGRELVARGPSAPAAAGRAPGAALQKTKNKKTRECQLVSGNGARQARVLGTQVEDRAGGSASGRPPTPTPGAAARTWLQGTQARPLATKFSMQLVQTRWSAEQSLQFCRVAGGKASGG